jgi:hypothetical protein
MTCDKKSFTSQRAANEVINSAKGNYRKAGAFGKKSKKNIPMRCYRCDICGQFHLTKSKGEYMRNY